MDLKQFKNLISLGFSDYEIKAYVSLLRNGPMSGYQVAKVSGVPRPNIYAVLEKLIARGAVDSVSNDGSSEYQALPATEMLNRLSHAYKADIDAAKEVLGALNKNAETPLGWNVRGYDALLSKARLMMTSAKKRLLIGLWPQEAALLTSSLKKVLNSGVVPTVLCMHGCEQECGGCHGELYRYPMDVGSKARSLILTTDRHQTLIAQIDGDGSAVGIHSETEVLAITVAQHLTNAIAVAEIVRSLGPKLLTIIDKEAMRALSGTGLAMGKNSWFDRVDQIVRKNQENGGNQNDDRIKYGS
jgi:predicted transcriptional regulator